MTLLIALKWILKDGEEGVVVASDSKVTVGFVSYEARKVYPIVMEVNGNYVPLAIAGGAGDVSVVKQSYRICERVLRDLAVKEWGKKTPSFDQFEKAVEQIESILISRFRKLREHGLESNFSMVLASVDQNGKASMYLFDERGLAEPVHDNPGFAVIGTDFFTGGNLLLRLLGYTPEESHKLNLGALSTFLIDVISEIDPAVGPFVGESYFMMVENGEVRLGALKEEATKEYKDMARKRKEIIRRIWRLCDQVGEEEVEKVLEEYVSQISQSTGE